MTSSLPTTPPQFTSTFIPHLLSPSQNIHLVTSSPPAPAPAPGTPLLLIHGLGSASSFWIPSLSTPAGRKLTQQRQVYAIDAYGHGVSDHVMAEEGLDLAAEGVKGVIEHLVGKEGKVMLVGHSMSGLVTSLVAARYPHLVEKLFLLSPTLELPPANRTSLSERAATVLKREGHLQISQAVSSSAISLTSHAEQPLAAAFIKHLVLTTRAESYAQACRNLSAHPGWVEDVAKIGCEVFILGGEEDYMVPGGEIMKRAEQVPEGRGKGVIMKNVGHWGGLEVPERVAEELLRFVQGEEGKATL